MAITSCLKEREQKTQIKLGNLYRSKSDDGSIVMSLMSGTKSHKDTNIQVFRCVLMHRGNHTKPSHIGDIYDNVPVDDVEEYNGELILISN